MFQGRKIHFYLNKGFLICVTDIIKYLKITSCLRVYLSAIICRGTWSVRTRKTKSTIQFDSTSLILISSFPREESFSLRVGLASRLVMRFSNVCLNSLSFFSSDSRDLIRLESSSVIVCIKSWRSYIVILSSVFREASRLFFCILLDYNNNSSVPRCQSVVALNKLDIYRKRNCFSVIPYSYMNILSLFHWLRRELRRLTKM